MRGVRPAEAGATDLASTVGALALLAVLLYAAYRDLVAREVSDHVWLAGGVVGLAVGLVIYAGSAVGVAAWLLVAGLVLEHLVPWDERLAPAHPTWPGFVEIAIYLVVGAGLVGLGVVEGVGATGVPFAAIATYVSVLVARGLFEFGILYGGADAKAVMVAGLLVPLDAGPWLALPSAALAPLTVYPFTLTLLMDAAVVAAVAPLALVVRNLRAGTLEFPRAFTSYRLPVEELPHRYVWLKDDALPSNPDDAETSEEDDALRRRQAAELTARGVREVWVSPQLPFVVFLAVGALLGLALGNVLFDLIAVA